jgi:hypothetical protein
MEREAFSVKRHGEDGVDGLRVRQGNSSPMTAMQRIENARQAEWQLQLKPTALKNK